MKSTLTRPIQFSLSALVLVLASSCVSQRQHDDMIATAKFNQKSLLEKEQYVAKLEAENERLKAALAQNSVSALSEANFGEDLESRLSELQGRIDNLGRPLEDIERFDVEGGYVLMVQDKILFASGSADLSGEGRQAIEKLSAEINAKPHGRIWVRGHTDSDPVSKPQTKALFPRGNLQLSAARAIEVASELSGSGKIAARDIAVVGFGQHDPIRPNKSADDKRLNRRVEIFVADQAVKAASAGN
jgi:chemotaxis protein MotB